MRFLLRGISLEQHDEYAIIDLYLITERDKLDEVLDKRFEYLESYKPIIHHFLFSFRAHKLLRSMKMELGLIYTYL